VGHDLVAKVENQSFIDRVISWILRHPVYVVLPVVGYKVISSGIHLSMPKSLWCQIQARSSISKRKLQVLGGVIDSGFRGELYTIIHNFGLLPRIIGDGERYAQAIFYWAARPEISFIEEWSQSLDVSERSDNGFGSTGK